MDEVKQIYDNWGNRASLKEPDIAPEGERVFNVGGYSITVPDDREQPAKVASLYNRWGASENPMPNMSFSEGEMRIPVEDFVDLILRRVPAEELAEGLWHDPVVRERFIYCMVNRWAGAVEDEDRRKVLDGIQVQIHAKAIDHAIERLNAIESNLRAATQRSRWEGIQYGHYTGIYERYKDALLELREAGKIDDDGYRRRLELQTTPDALKKYAMDEADPVVKESTGPSWYESRDFWRAKLAEAFPEPINEVPAVTADVL
jgi:hypothetical protein